MPVKATVCWPEKWARRGVVREKKSSERVIDGNEKVGFVIGAVTLASRFDFPVGRRSVGQACA